MINFTDFEIKCLIEQLELDEEILKEMENEKSEFATTILNVLNKLRELQKGE